MLVELSGSAPAFGLSVGMAAMATRQSLDLRSLAESIAFTMKTPVGALKALFG
jgi:hypothetical protein